jgi:hypothetical protein
MNTKLLLKTIFLLLVLLLVVMIGRYNPAEVSLALPPLLPKSLHIPTAIKAPAAVMYWAFFAVGVLAGVIMSVGGGRKPAGDSARPGKSGK